MPFFVRCVRTWSPLGSNGNKQPSLVANPEKRTVPAVSHVCYTPETSQPFQKNTFAWWLVLVFMRVSLKENNSPWKPPPTSGRS